MLFKAVDVTLQRAVAIKLLAPELAQDREVVERFLREARAMARINDPNVVQVYGADEQDSQPYMAVEFAPHALQVLRQARQAIGARRVTVFRQLSQINLQNHGARVNQTWAFALDCRMRIPILIGLLFLPLALHAATGCAPLPGTVTPNVRWPQVWQALTDQSNCTQNCHVGDSGSAGLDLSNLTNSIYFLVSQQSSQSSVFLVDAGNARNSLFFQKVNCTGPDVGGRMPPGGNVPVNLQALIYDWIEQGAYGENPNDPASRDFIFKDGAESQRR